MISASVDNSNTVLFDIFDPFKKYTSGFYLKSIENNESIRMADIILSQSYYPNIIVDIISTGSDQKIKTDNTTSFNTKQCMNINNLSDEEDLSIVFFPQKIISQGVTFVNSHKRGTFGPLDDTYLED